MSRSEARFQKGCPVTFVGSQISRALRVGILLMVLPVYFNNNYNNNNEEKEEGAA